MKSLRERTEIQQSCLEGEKTIQLKSYENKVWMDCELEPDFDWVRYDHRIKPEPLTVFCNVYAERVYCHTSERVAKNAVQQDAIRAGVKCVECE